MSAYKCTPICTQKHDIMIYCRIIYIYIMCSYMPLYAHQIKPVVQYIIGQWMLPSCYWQPPPYTRCPVGAKVPPGMVKMGIRCWGQGLAKHLLWGSLPQKGTNIEMHQQNQEACVSSHIFTWMGTHQDPSCVIIRLLAYWNIYSEPTETSQIHLQAVKNKCFSATFSRP